MLRSRAAATTSWKEQVALRIRIAGVECSLLKLKSMLVSVISPQHE